MLEESIDRCAQNQRQWLGEVMPFPPRWCLTAASLSRKQKKKRYFPEFGTHDAVVLWKVSLMVAEYHRYRDFD